MEARRWAGSTLVLAIASAMPAVGQEDAARSVIVAAIKAHGGEDRLARVRADRVKSHGTLFADKKEFPFVCETVAQLPNHFKNIVEMTTEGKPHTIVHLINGDKAMTVIDGRPFKPDPATLAEMQDKMLLDRVIRLVPLLRDRTFDLVLLEPAKVNDRPAVGIKVTSRTRREFRLYFDKEMGLLVKTEHVLGDATGKSVREEHYFGNFKEVEGCLRPFKIAAYRDGKKIMEAEVTDVKRLDKIDESEFTRP
jgi:hypothetical protein